MYRKLVFFSLLEGVHYNKNNNIHTQRGRGRDRTGRQAVVVVVMMSSGNGQWSECLWISVCFVVLLMQRLSGREAIGLCEASS